MFLTTKHPATPPIVKLRKDAGPTGRILPNQNPHKKTPVKVIDAFTIA
jgi:hypothetical protein